MSTSNYFKLGKEHVFFFDGDNLKSTSEAYEAALDCKARTSYLSRTPICVWEEPTNTGAWSGGRVIGK